MCMFVCVYNFFPLLDTSNKVVNLVHCTNPGQVAMRPVAVDETVKIHSVPDERIAKTHFFTVMNRRRMGQ